MKTVKIVINLEIDVDTDEQCENVLNEMDWDFRHIEMDEIGKHDLIEVNRIIKQEIIQWEIQ